MKNRRVEWLLPYRYPALADLETQLETLAAEGWEADRVRQTDSIWMVFHKAEPRKYKYVAEMNAFPRKDYKAHYEQFGWTFLGRMASLHFWRMAYTDTPPQAFSDRQSLRARNMGLATALWALIGFFTLALIALSVLFALHTDGTAQAWMGFLITAVLLAIWIPILAAALRSVYRNKNR